MLDTLQQANSSEVMHRWPRCAATAGHCCVNCVVVGVGFSSKCQGSEAFQQLSIPCTLKGFFFSLLNSWMSTVSMVFSSALTEKVLLSLKSTKSKDLQEVSNDESISNYFIRSI